MDSIGRILLVVGGLIMLTGGALLLLGRVPGVGRLPGDIFIQRDGVSFYIPLATSIILSLVLTVVLNIVLRLWNR